MDEGGGEDGGGEIEGGGRGKEMSFGEKDGQEFGDVEITLISVVELYVPNKFVVRGHVVVSDHAVIPTGTERDHAVIPTGTELHLDVDPSLPMGQRGVAMVGTEGVRLHRPPPGGVMAWGTGCEERVRSAIVG